MLEYLPVAITPFTEDELARRVARRRLIADHADQIVARRTGVVRRMLMIVVRRADGRSRHRAAAAAR
ncbi:hypothetical protein ACI3KS_12195 [Microbacterium sp. ZW T5_45]|uniref:hypothetical protein n=1 Tax=Microbacterium sp. ZW T5_45 TaxID=3378080 RepID=UPI003852EFAC